MKTVSNTEFEFKKSVAYKKRVYVVYYMKYFKLRIDC